MTTERLMTTLSALALGFAVAGAVPAIAQNTTAPQPAPTPPAATAPSPTPATPPPAATMPATPPSTAMHQAHPTHHMAMTHVRRRTYQSPTAQNAEVDRLNEQSLQAAQHGQTFTPSGTAPGT